MHMLHVSFYQRSNTIPTFPRHEAGTEIILATYFIGRKGS